MKRLNFNFRTFDQRMCVLAAAGLGVLAALLILYPGSFAAFMLTILMIAVPVAFSVGVLMWVSYGEEV